MRRLSGRARKHRQIPQVGVELAGVAGPEGDLELLALAADSLRAMGLARFTLDMGDAGVVRSLLAGLPADAQGLISEAIAQKDDVAIAAATAQSRAAVCAPYTDAIRALPLLHGKRDALVAGVEQLADTPAAGAARRLLALFDAAASRGLAEHLTVDLGEVRGFAYYTGPIFHVYAAGTGDAVGSGGRYDELLGRFGWDLPAAGFALDLDRVGEALGATGAAGRGRPVRVVVVGPADDPRIADLRARGVPAVAADDRASGMRWAAGWGFSHLVDAAGWVDVASGASIASPVDGPADKPRRA